MLRATQADKLKANLVPYNRINQGRSLTERECAHGSTAVAPGEMLIANSKGSPKAAITGAGPYKSLGSFRTANVKLHLTPAMTLPPFPEDIPTHPLLVVDYQKLVEDDAAEIEQFWHAATTLGFW